MTPYSAAAGRQLLEPAELALGLPSAASSGSSASSIRSRSSCDLGLLLVALAELVLDRLHLLAQEVLALALVDLGLDLRLDLGPEPDHLELAGEDLREAAQPLGDVDLLEQLLLLLDRDPQRARRSGG